MTGLSDVIDAAGQTAARRHRVLWRPWCRGMLVVVVAVLAASGVAIAARTFGLHPVKVTSHSMWPTIGAGDWIVVRDLAESQQQEINRGDVVLFRFPPGSPGRAVKRVVAIGGDTVRVADRTVSVNGRVSAIAVAPTEGVRRARVVTVPRGHAFLLGDNAASSIDSRSFGPMPYRELVGRQLVVIGSPVAALLVVLGIAVLMAWACAAASKLGAAAGALDGGSVTP